MNYLYIYLILLAYFLIWYVIAQIKKNNGLVDIGEGNRSNAVSSYLVINIDTGLIVTGLIFGAKVIFII